MPGRAVYYFSVLLSVDILNTPNCRSFESRNLDCNIDPDLSMEERAGTYYNCSMLPLFDLGSLHHDFYLLNIRLG